MSTNTTTGTKAIVFNGSQVFALDLVNIVQAYDISPSPEFADHTLQNLGIMDTSMSCIVALGNGDSSVVVSLLKSTGATDITAYDL